MKPHVFLMVVHCTQEGDKETEPSPGLLKEKLNPRKKMPALLDDLASRPAERLHYLGVSYGLTSSLYKFWKRKSFSPVYIRQTPNDLTGEFSCIMLKPLRTDDLAVAPENGWLWSYRYDFIKRFTNLLRSSFSKIPVDLALSVLDKKSMDKYKGETASLNASTLEIFLSARDLKRLEAYSRNMIDNHMIRDLIPILSNLYFFNRLGSQLKLSSLQCAILLGMGLQSKTIDDLAEETTLPAGQLLAMFNKAIRKISKRLKVIFEDEITKEVDAALAKNKKKITTKLKTNKNGDHHSQVSEVGTKSVPTEYMEYAVPEGIEAVLASRTKGAKIGSTVSVKRKREEEADEAAEIEKKKKLAVENKKRRNKLKKQKKKQRDKEKK